jgi:outer membrane lipoprotein-sorting protein
MIGKIAVSLLILTPLLSAQTSEEIVKRVDANITADTKVIVSKMIIHGRRSTRTVEAKSYIDGTNKAFTEYLAPARDAGTKMLKLADQLWTYSPQTDRIIQISGHMLRQSMMGADLSYEDMMEDPRLATLYTAEIIAEEELQTRQCWVLALTSRTGEIAYHTRRVWVDKQRFILLKEERFAKGGKLLKTTTVKKVESLEGRWAATNVLFKDELQSGQGTEFILESIQFNAPIPDYFFTKAVLRK